jgi:hypothetical protein
VAGFRTGAGRCSPGDQRGSDHERSTQWADGNLDTPHTVDRRCVDIARPSLYRQRRAFEVLVLEQMMSRRLRVSSTSGAANRGSLIEASSSTKTVCPMREHHRRHESHLTGARRAMRAGLPP